MLFFLIVYLKRNDILTFGFVISFVKASSEKQALDFVHFVKISKRLFEITSSGRLLARRARVFFIVGVTLASVPLAIIMIAVNEPTSIAVLIIS
jgi:hypothetical protein